MKERQKYALVALVMFFVASAGCDFFRPRDPDPPGGSVCPQQLASEPDIVLANVEAAVGCLEVGTYMRSFSDDFMFHPDSGDSLYFLGQEEEPFVDWNYNVEQTVMGNVFGLADSAIAAFSEPGNVLESGEERIYLDTPYSLRIVDGNGVSTTYDGLATLRFRRDNTGNWSIFSWEDRTSQTGNNSWGWLRGKQRGGG